MTIKQMQYQINNTLLIAFIGLKQAIHELDLNKDFALQRTKQALLYVVCSVDSYGNLSNECLMRNIALNGNDAAIKKSNNNRDKINTTDRPSCDVNLSRFLLRSSPNFKYHLYSTYLC